MLPIGCNFPRDASLKVLCLGAHCDDIEIGCGGTLRILCQQYANIDVNWIVFSARDEQRKQEATRSAELFLKDVRTKTVVMKDFEDTLFPYSGRDIKDFFRQCSTSFQPDLIFTHYRHDLHQDHRLLCELTWNAFRNHLILEYEIPKFDGDLGTPNFFVPLGEDVVQEKIAHLCANFPTQLSKPWFSPDTFRGLMRLRGMECNAESGFAEAFYCRKICYA
jgi:LmbE family N-acetylglucosaminyl deacetylase